MTRKTYDRGVRKRIRLRKAADKLSLLFYSTTTPIITKDRAQRFRRLREALQISQLEMAEKIGMSQANYCKMENGQKTHVSLTLMQFKESLSEYFSYVMLGHGEFAISLIEANKLVDLQEKRREFLSWGCL